MLAKIIYGTNLGISSVRVDVEVDIASMGLPSFTIVGLADQAIEEAKERVRSAIRNSDCDFPAQRITVNLAPADLPKEGPTFDLAIALGLLVGSEQLAPISDTLMVGELSLDGSLRKVNGVLPLSFLAKQLGLKRIFVPKENAPEAAIVEGLEVYSFDNLAQLIKFLNKQIQILPTLKTVLNLSDQASVEHDFSQIKGQEQAKRALEIAAAGAHNLLMKGPPGAGKTLLAKSFSSILPSLSLEEALEVTKIFSITGKLAKEGLIVKRPFRSPHHSASFVGLIGGGSSIKPGEISLAHRGVLFLDELPEFPRQILESLRQPLEDHQITIARSSGTITFPSQFILLAAQNPCPCGYFNSGVKACFCGVGEITRYQKKVSGPLLDRIDIHLDVPPVNIDNLTSQEKSESSFQVRGRVQKARKVQRQRLSKLGIYTNSEMSSAQVKKFCGLNKPGLSLGIVKPC